MASTSGEMRAVNPDLSLLRSPSWQPDQPTESERQVAHLLSSNPLDDPFNRATKRLFDIVLSVAIIIGTSWLMLLVWLAIKFESRGPAMFSQLDDGQQVKRVGLDGMPFPYVKFRSMRPGSHNERYTSLAPLNTRNGPLVKIRNDPRVTRVGAFIRKWHLDELPEFFLVLRGHMSIVGPRPHMPEEVNKYKHWQRGVLSVKPGITGESQINGGSRNNFQQEIAHDFKYIANWSLWRDFVITLSTPIAIARRKGDC